MSNNNDEHDESLLLSLKESLEITKRLKLMLVLGILAFSSNFVADNLNKRIADSTDKVACIPADKEISYPSIYSQSSYNYANEDSKIKNFMEQYIHYSLDENIVNYHRVTNNSRYSSRLSQHKKLAINMSEKRERSLNMKKFSESFETANTLKKGGVGWVFLIDCMKIGALPGAGVYYVEVDGGFQLTHDTVKTKLPSKLWGYRRYNYLISKGNPLKDSSGKFINEWGYYVHDSQFKELTLNQMKKSISGCNYSYKKK
jgi:hypothetical protein